MEYILGVCPHCNNVMSMPDDSPIVRCPTCHSEVAAAEAAALAGAANGQGAPGSAQQAPQQPPSPYGPGIAPAGGPAAGGIPVAANWKTSAGMTVAGIVVEALLTGYLTSAMSDMDNPLGMMAAIFAFLYLVFSLVYALKVYPSYFTGQPMLASNEAIAFLNGLVGGIIWGLLWNHNLTRGEAGVSHVVFAVLTILGLVLSLVGPPLSAGSYAAFA